MGERTDLEREIADQQRQAAKLRCRESRISDVLASMVAGADLATVLQEVVDTACAITVASYGCIATFDRVGELRDFYISGLTQDEQHQLRQMPDWAKLSEFLKAGNDLSRVGGIADPTIHLRPLTMSLPDPFGSSIVIPLDAGVRRVGALLLSNEDQSGEFTKDDERILIRLAALAVIAILDANLEGEAKQYQTRSDAMMETLPVGAVIFDAVHGQIEQFNQEASRMLASLHNPEETLDELFSKLTVRFLDAQESPLGDKSLAWLLMAGRSLREAEVELNAPDGNKLRISLSASPIYSKYKKLESVIIVFRELAPFDELDRSKTGFLGRVSQELQMPLVTIRGVTATMLSPSRTSNPEEMQQFFRIIDSQAELLTNKMRDFLDIAQIETGRLLVMTEPTDLATIMDEAREQFVSAGGRNNLQFAFSPGIRPVMADRRRIVQVLTHLLWNASKNSAESSPIQIALEQQADSVTVSVSHQGIGIPTEQLPQLFKKISGSADEGSGNITGSTMRLAVCKGIMEAHGGSIWAESEGAGAGARFSVTLPLATLGEARNPASDPPSAVPRSTADSAHILVVDDDHSLLSYVREILTEAGYTPVVTADPKSAVGMMEEYAPELVLMDMKLPGTDGVEVMQQLLAVARVPVVFISAYEDHALVTRALGAGAIDYVIKPFSPAELVARIRAAKRKHEEEQPSEPFVLDDLKIDYSERRVTLAGNPIDLTSIEYRMLRELSAYAGRALTHEHLLRHVWRREGSADLGPMRTVVKGLRRKLGDDASNPTYLFTEPRIGYRMGKGE